MLLAEGDGSVYKNNENKDDFYAFFRRGLCDMESCFDCPYREHSGADVRIGDYWGDKFIKDKRPGIRPKNRSGARQRTFYEWVKGTKHTIPIFLLY